MKLDESQADEVKKLKTEIASIYGVKDFEDIDRGNVSSRANGSITRTLVEMAEKKMNDSVPGIDNLNKGSNTEIKVTGQNNKL